MASEIEIKKILAEQLGIEVGEINLRDSLREDYLMSASDLTELLHSLIELGFKEDAFDFTEIETVEDLIEAVKSEEQI